MTTYEEAVEQGFNFDDVSAVFFEVLQFQDGSGKKKQNVLEQWLSHFIGTEKGRKEIRETLDLCETSEEIPEWLKDIEDIQERLESEAYEQSSDPFLVESLCDWYIAENYKTDEEKKQFLEELKKEYPPEEW